ncbi:hypothetical protein [Methylopila sp. 73B]|uniref:hypothetical protein n=1 Tax=Methylopila sp. 73B TaxID=1120792 RepID=UPI0003600BDA|nr:hypothetical protein [Methylopila sp. 73B]
MANRLKAAALAVYHTTYEPALALVLGPRRISGFECAAAGGPPEVAIHPHRVAGCGPACGFDQGERRRVVARYSLKTRGDGALDRALGRAARRLSLTPMAIDLDRFPSHTDFQALVKRRSSRTLPKIRKAAKMGYVAERFSVHAHVYDIHAVRTSMRSRAAGPVLDYWFLKPEDVAKPAGRPATWRMPKCPRHWTLWWGVFLPEPGHVQGKVQVDRRLVAYMKLMRIGDVLHYTDLMGHGEHLGHGVMNLLHDAIIRWLIESDEPLVEGVRVVLYGAAEHGGEGLLTWKKRAGFEPMRLILAPAPDGKTDAPLSRDRRAG